MLQWVMQNIHIHLIYNNEIVYHIQRLLGFLIHQKQKKIFAPLETKMFILHILLKNHFVWTPVGCVSTIGIEPTTIEPTTTTTLETTATTTVIQWP